MDDQPIEPDALLSRAEVAAMLCVGPKTVARWAKAGKLNSFRTPGGHRRFLKADVLTLMTGVQHTHDGSHAPVQLPVAGHASASTLTSISAEHDEMYYGIARDGAATGPDPWPPLRLWRRLSRSPWKLRPMRRPGPLPRQPMRLLPPPRQLRRRRWRLVEPERMPQQWRLRRSPPTLRERLPRCSCERMTCRQHGRGGVTGGRDRRGGDPAGP